MLCHVEPASGKHPVVPSNRDERAGMLAKVGLGARPCRFRRGQVTQNTLIITISAISRMV